MGEVRGGEKLKWELQPGIQWYEQTQSPSVELGKTRAGLLLATRQCRLPRLQMQGEDPTHLVFTQGLSVGLIQNDLHDAKHLLSHSCSPTVLAFLLSYQGL